MPELLQTHPGDDDLTPLAKPAGRPLINAMSPFRVGFALTLGGLVAYHLVQAALRAQSVLILLVVALFLALGLNPAVEFFQRRGLKRSLSVALVLLLVVVVLALAAFAVVPVFTRQISDLVSTAPQFLNDLLRNRQIRALDNRFHFISKAQKAVSSTGLVSGAFGGILGAGVAVVSAVFSGFTLVILTLYFLASLPTIKGVIYRLAPASSREQVRKIEDQIFAQISAYLSGTFLVAAIAGLLSFGFLVVVGLGEYALALAVVVSVLDIIPLIGSSIAAVIVVIVAFVDSTTTGIAAVVFYTIYQQFENYVVMPRVFSKRVDIPGSVVVIAALIGGTLLGIVGALLAVPVAAALLLILHDVVQPTLDES